MGMSIQLNLYEALTEAGVSPDKARAVERQLENAIQTGLDMNRKDIMTKTDGAELKADVLKPLLICNAGSLRHFWESLA